MFSIENERPAHTLAREALLERAFGPTRFAKTCERLREGRLPAAGLAFAALSGEGLVGTLRFWHVDAGGVPALMLGPLAVDENFRSCGLGAALMRHGLGSAASLGYKGVLLVGDAPYYNRFGFERARAEPLALPGPVESARFLGLELVPGALQGACGLVRATGKMVVQTRGAERDRRFAA